MVMERNVLALGEMYFLVAGGWWWWEKRGKTISIPLFTNEETLVLIVELVCVLIIETKRKSS